MTDDTIWTSPARKIGKHEWRIRQYRHPQHGIVATYEWRGPANDRLPADYWQDMTRWPGYDMNNGTTAGCPASLRKLFQDHRQTLEDNKAQHSRNDCQQAFAILAKHHADQATPTKLTIRRLAAPAGTISDGTRAFTVRPCPRWRWLIVELGDTVAEIDQREHFQAPERMALAVLDAIEARAEAGREYRAELTAAGEQSVIPGCERNASPKMRQLDLFG